MDDKKEFQKKIRRFDRKVAQILINVLVSILTTTFILHCAGIIP